MTLHTETMWAIASRRRDYTRLDGVLGHTAKEVIYKHCKQYEPKDDWDAHERFWQGRLKQGDRAVPVTITYEYPE